MPISYSNDEMKTSDLNNFFFAEYFEKVCQRVKATITQRKFQYHQSIDFPQGIHYLPPLPIH